MNPFFPCGKATLLEIESQVMLYACPYLRDIDRGYAVCGKRLLITQVLYTIQIVCQVWFLCLGARQRPPVE